MNQLKALINYIYKYRYLITIVAIILLSVFKISGSSIGIYNTIQPNHQEKNFAPVLGIARAIRSDEWLVEVPKIVTQGFNNYNIENEYFAGMTTIMTRPVANFTILANIPMIVFLLFDFETAYSMYWWIRIFALLLVSLEFFMLLTNKSKKWSILGMLLVGLAPRNFMVVFSPSFRAFHISNVNNSINEQVHGKQQNIHKTANINRAIFRRNRIHFSNVSSN